MSIAHLLPFLLNEGGSNTFYTFSNADGKRWLMPAKNMRTAMNLYQPSGIKGKGMKALFPYLYRLGVVNKAVGAEKKRYELVPELEKLLCRLFGTGDIEFSIFCGTPCVHQKITMQISKGARILSYAKFSDNDEIKHIFRQEQETLDYLEQKGVTSVPRCLYSGEWRDGLGLFVQTTTKTRHSSTDHRWNEREMAFLEELHEKTKQHIPFEETEYYRDLCLLCEEMNNLPGFETRPIVEGVSKVLNFYVHREVVFSFYHADFTPWNIYVEKGRLYAFDFEYAKRTYPPYLDYFHFFTQTAIFEEHLGADGIWKLFQHDKERLQSLFGNPDLAYTSYLLGIIAHYVKREKGVFTGDVQRNMKLWIGLLKYLCK